MAKHGKKYRAAADKIDVDKEYSLLDAVKLLKEVSYTKFDSTLEGHFNVKYKSSQNVRGIVQLPHGTGKKVKILVFAKGEKAEEAKTRAANIARLMLHKIQTV